MVGFAFYLGMSMWPFGVAFIVRYVGAPARHVYTPLGLYLLILWLLPENLSEPLFGEYDSGFEMFFVSGLFLVLGSSMLVVENTDLLLGGITRLGTVFRGWLPMIRTAVAYPSAARVRTGLTISMFSLIIFSLVMMATINTNVINLFLGDEANAGWDVRADTVGTNPITDFRATLEAKGVATDGFGQTAIVTTPHVASQARLIDGEWAFALVRGMDNAFISQSTLGFQQRAEGYESDQAIFEALRTQPNVAVVDSFAVPNKNLVGGDPDRFLLKGLTTDDKVFAPVRIEVDDPDSPTPAQLTIIGVVDSKYGSLYGIYTNQFTVDAIYPKMHLRSYYIALTDPDQAGATAKRIEATLLSSGVQATSIRDELKEGQRQTEGFFYVFEGFMGLGLIVGIAAVGVIAFRSVVERRHYIGVLRAIGFQREEVAGSFLIETCYIVGIAILAGTSLGLLLSRNLFASDLMGAGAAGIAIPWMTLAIVIVGTISSALLMTWIPARRAAGISPADALRYE
jgi:putative ABC transport system permease protein